MANNTNVRIDINELGIPTLNALNQLIGRGLRFRDAGEVMQLEETDEGRSEDDVPDIQGEFSRQLWGDNDVRVGPVNTNCGHKNEDMMSVSEYEDENQDDEENDISKLIKNIKVMYNASQNLDQIQLKQTTACKKIYDNEMKDINKISIREYGDNAWLLGRDFIQNNNNNFELRQQVLNNVMILIENILKKDIIDVKDYDDAFIMYITKASQGSNMIIDKMYDEDHMWTFDPMRKIVWIFLMLACEYEPRAIKYLLKYAKQYENIYCDINAYGSSCILIACRDSSSKLLKELNGDNLLTNVMFKGQPTNRTLDPILYAIKNSEVFEYIYETVPNLQTIIKNTYNNKMTVFLLACYHNQNVVEYLLNSEFMSSEYFSQIDNNNLSCLMIAAMFNPELLPTLLESEYCTQELFSFINPIYGNILSVIVKFCPDLLEFALESQYINIDTMSCKDANNYNVLYVALANDNLEGFEQLIKSKYCTYKILSEINNNQYIFETLIYLNIDFLIQLLNKYTDKFEKCIYQCIDEIIDYDVSEIKKILDNPVINKVFNETENLIGNILYQTDVDINDIELIFLKYVSMDALKQIIYNESNKTHELNGLNVFTILALNYPSIALKIMQRDNFDQSILIENIYAQKMKKFVPMYFAIISRVNNADLINEILKSDTTNNIFNIFTNDNNNNILLEMAQFNLDNIITLINHKSCTEKILMHTNYDEDNLILKILSDGYDSYDADDGDNNNNETYDSIYHTIKYIIDKVPQSINAINEFSVTSLSLASSCRHDIFNLIFKSEYLDKNIFSIISNSSMTCLTYACIENQLENLKDILDSPLMTQELFTYSNKSVNKSDVIFYALTSKPEIAQCIINHKFCNKELLYNAISDSIKINIKMSNDINKKICESNNISIDILKLKTNVEPLIHEIMKIDIDLFVKIIESPLCSQELLSIANNNGDNILVANRGDFILFNKILNNEHINSQILESVNLNGNNILHLLMKEDLSSNNKKMISDILNSEFASNNMLTVLNNDGKNFVTEIYQDFEIAKLILNKDYVTPDVLLAKNKNGYNCLHNIAINSEYHDSINILKLVLNSNKCSKELLNGKDNSNRNFLHINHEYLEYVLKHKDFASNLLEDVSNDNDNYNVFMALCNKNQKLMKKVLNSDYMSEKMFGINKNNKINALTYSAMIDNGSFEIILESKYCTNEIMNSTNSDNMTLLSTLAKNNSDKMIEKLLDSSFDFTESFKIFNICEENILMMITLSNAKTFNTIMKSKYITKELMLHGNQYGHNFITTVFSKNLYLVKDIMNSKIWDQDLVNYIDDDGNSLLMHCMDEPMIVKYILSKISTSKIMMKINNVMEMNPIHYYALGNQTSFKYALKSFACSNDIILKQDIYGNTCLHLMCKDDPKNFSILLNSKYMTSELLNKQNKKGETAIMLALKYNKHLITDIIKANHFDKIDIKITDTKGNNLMMYVIRYDDSDKIFDHILNLNKDIEYCLNYRNNKHHTPIMYAGIHNGNIVGKLLNTGLIKLIMLYHGDSNKGSVLTLTAKFQPLGLKHMLKWDGLTNKIINVLDNNYNFFQIACINNSNSVKYALSSKFDLTHLINNKYPHPAIMLVTGNQPDGLKALLESNYCTQNLFELVIGDNRTIIDEAYDSQPQSLKYILESKFATDNFINRENFKGYRLFTILKETYPDLVNIKDVMTNNLTNYPNVKVDENDKSLCMICCAHKMNVVFVPCGHQVCISCAFKMKECPNCRSEIKNKIVTF